VSSLLLVIASRQHHLSIAEADFYRFPPILIAALRVCVVLFPLVGFLIYRSFRHPLEWYESAFLLGTFCAITLILGLQLWVVTTYSLEARIGCLLVRDWRGKREIRTAEIRKVIVAHPWRGRGYIDVFGPQHTKPERIDGGLQDFEALAAFIVNQCEAGTIVREKSPGKSWSERVI
jgi:hypothetical protein